MIPAMVDTIIAPSEYSELSNEEFCERFLLPMITKLRKVEGQNVENPDMIHIRLSAYPTFDWMYSDDSE